MINRLIFLLVLLTSSLFGGDFHGIVVGQTDLDVIDSHVFLDIHRMKFLMMKISKSLGRELKIHEFIEEDVQSDLILRKISGLELQSDDIVLFYFSGHGQQGESPWPLMKLNGRAAISLKTVAKKLVEKDPQLVIAIADCCNQHLTVDPVEVYFSEPKGNLKPMTDKERMKFNCERLFSDHSGLILISSSVSGTPSFTDLFGSRFTTFFQQALYSELKEEETSWEIILLKTDQHLGDSQHPQIMILPLKEEVNNL